MRRQTLGDSSSRSVAVHFWVVKPFDNVGVARSLMDVLSSFGFSHDEIDLGWERNHFVPLPEHEQDFLSKWLHQRDERDIGKHLLLRRTSWPRGTLRATVDATGVLPFDLFYLDCETRFVENPEGQDAFIRLCIALYDLLHPAFGQVDEILTMAKAESPVKLRAGLPGLLWGTFFGPEYVGMFGEKRVRELATSFPVYLEWLSDDGFFLRLAPTLREARSTNLDQLLEGIKTHLGLECFSSGRQGAELGARLESRKARVPSFRFLEARKSRLAGHMNEGDRH